MAVKISIITVCYNSVGTIRNTIESVLSQTHKDVEYILVDGGSNDGTLAIIEEYKDAISRLVSEPDSGIYDAMNKGIALASGEVVGILNSDDYFEDDRVLADVASDFAADPGADIVFGNVVFVRPDDLHKVVRYYDSSRFRPWKLRFGWMPPHPATFVRRQIYRNHGLYRTDYAIASDYEMFVRWLLVHRLRYRRLDRVLVRMRMGGVSTGGLRSSLLLNREIVRACRANGVYTNLPLVLCKLPVKLLELAKRPAQKR